MITPKRCNARVQDIIAELVRGKRVLDVGCVGSADHATSDTWLHGHVTRNAAYTLGVDILEQEIERLRQGGYNVICGDATSVELADRFDVITAGEIIEHIDNPGKFLQNMRRHLKDDGILVLTTPNAFYALHFLESIFASPYSRWCPSHVALHCYFTLENLLKRNAMWVEHCYYAPRSRKIRRLLRLLGLGCPSFLASTLLVVARKEIQSTEVCSAGDLRTPASPDLEGHDNGSSVRYRPPEDLRMSAASPGARNLTRRIGTLTASCFIRRWRSWSVTPGHVRPPRSGNPSQRSS